MGIDQGVYGSLEILRHDVQTFVEALRVTKVNWAMKHDVEVMVQQVQV